MHPRFTFAERLHAVRSRIAAACARAHRAEASVTLLAVTKVFPASIVEEAYASGLREFGENYVQEFEDKRAQLPACPEAVFHLIGHLQSNKASKAADLFQVIQTVDTSKLARRLNEAVNDLEVMIEVKLGDEPSKHGCAPDDLPALIESVRTCPNLRLTGLMTIPPWDDDPEKSRSYFARLQRLAQTHGVERISMGMSNDLEAAIEEGSTIVRVGTALFGPRKRP